MILDLLILIFAGLSIVSNTILLIVFICNKKLFKYPGNYLFALCIFLILSNLHWVTINEQVYEYIVHTTSMCFEFSILNVLVYFFVWNYSTVLSLVIHDKLKYRPVLNYRSRTLIYNISCGVLSISETIAIYLLGKFGESKLKTCFIIEKSPGEIIYLIPLVMNLPIALYSVVIMLKKIYRKKKFIPIAMVLLSLIITWGLPTIINLIIYFLSSVLITKPYFECLNASSGLLLTISYFSCSEILIKLKLKKKTIEGTTVYFSSSLLQVNKSLDFSEEVKNEESDESIRYLENGQKVVGGI